eukprot:CAMPEP_0194415872 /NCGR_PEP_ID=MMETSP0176-20130528/14721_1 /TAXON_ID=216777 /ORGANISM="Proboscia alata, Strain PI-D3" /LENGTH=586 /DNA_ID=CAMNT_0039220799 /DNA_START=97 /DNA_END=1858 /DNA_ORIENTATION=-
MGNICRITGPNFGQFNVTLFTLISSEGAEDETRKQDLRDRRRGLIDRQQSEGLMCRKQPVLSTSNDAEYEEEDIMSWKSTKRISQLLVAVNGKEALNDDTSPTNTGELNRGGHIDIPMIHGSLSTIGTSASMFLPKVLKGGQVKPWTTLTDKKPDGSYVDIHSEVDKNVPPMAHDSLSTFDSTIDTRPSMILPSKTNDNAEEEGIPSRIVEFEPYQLRKSPTAPTVTHENNILSFHIKNIRPLKSSGSRTITSQSDPSEMWTSIRQVWETQEQTNHQTALRNYVFFLEGMETGISKRATFRTSTTVVICFTALTIVILISTGSIIPLFSTEYYGILGIAINYNGEQNGETYTYALLGFVNSLIDLAWNLGTTYDKIGLGLLAVLITVGTLIVPICHVSLLLTLWFQPMSLRKKSTIFSALEWIKAWQFTEVVLLAILLATSRLSSMSQMLNERCDESLNLVFESMVQSGLLSPENSQCLDLVASHGQGTELLVVATVLLIALSYFVSLAGTEAVQDEELRRERRTALNPEDPVVLIAPIPRHFLGPFRCCLDIQYPSAQRLDKSGNYDIVNKGRGVSIMGDIASPI